jgi:hypothetical protein
VAAQENEASLVVGRLARDEVRGRVGRVMEVEASCVHLRPPYGGREWTVKPEQVTPLTTVTEELSAKVAEINNDPTRGLR